MYDQGKKDTGKPFDVNKSKKLKIKSSVNNDMIKLFEEIFMENLPDETVLDVSYCFLLISCKENMRKILGILNALRAI